MRLFQTLKEASLVPLRGEAARSFLSGTSLINTGSSCRRKGSVAMQPGLSSQRDGMANQVPTSWGVLPFPNTLSYNTLNTVNFSTLHFHWHSQESDTSARWLPSEADAHGFCSLPAALPTAHRSPAVSSGVPGCLVPHFHWRIRKRSGHPCRDTTQFLHWPWV